MDRYPHQFSGGQRQRIGIARAIVVEPSILVADEAVSSLDVSVQMQVLNLILDIRDKLGLAVIFITHNIGVVEYLCDQVIVLSRGEVVERGPTAQVVGDPQHPYTRGLLSAVPRI
jgi:ABC-type oligopeptide transport system ATPase subunit